MIAWCLLVVCEGAIPTLLDADYHRRHLHSFAGSEFIKLADVVVRESRDWLALSAQTPRNGSLLVYLQTFCALPDVGDLRNIVQPFRLFGPISVWHRVNFGPFSHVEVPFTDNVHEARLANKFAECKQPQQPPTRTQLQMLLDFELLESWQVSQSSAVFHSKITPLPIGFGFEKHRMAGEPLDQYRDKMVRILKQHNGAPRDRLLLVSFSDHREFFANSTHGNPRHTSLNAVLTSASLVEFSSPQHFDTDEAWLTALRRSKFVLSPPGWGPDCFRHYEAIAMGCVPIIHGDYIVSQILQGMPFLPLESWSVLRTGGADFLNSEYHRLLQRDYRLDRLFLDYWIEMLTSA